MEGGGNGVVVVEAPISARGSSSYAVELADENQLKLEVGSGGVNLWFN